MNWQINVVLFFLGVSLLFYVLFAGADFGAGILELFLRKKNQEAQRALITRAMAPVWEANHVWLVLVVVILFMAFPPIYAALCVHLYIPVLAVLVGIVFRGCAFTFRHYDTDKTYYRAYSWGFSLSSLWTSFFLGVTGGALFGGNLDPGATQFAPLYLAPWWNPFCVAMGIFTSCLFAFLAAVFLVGEAKTAALQKPFKRLAMGTNGALVAAGGSVFFFGQRGSLKLADTFFSHPISLGCFVVAGLLWFPFWHSLLKASHRNLVVRAVGVAIVALVLFGWFANQYPVAIRFTDGRTVSFLTAAAPPATLSALLGALIAGTFLIFPALGYLFKVFKWETLEEKT